MALVINSNPAASAASSNLNVNNTKLQKSLNRLSSGDKIISPADDAGGLAVSMKMSAAIRRTEAVNTNVANAVSFLQTQDGALQNATDILTRISELRMLFNDVTKSADDKANYTVEFLQLASQLGSLLTEQFNGVNLFSASGSTLTVYTAEDASQTVTITMANLASAVSALEAASSLSAAAVSVGALTSAIQAVATLRATNGAQTSRLGFAAEMLTVNQTNLEAANSRIKDTDVATESTEFARYNILVQAGTAMLAQANSSSQIALRLLQ